VTGDEAHPDEEERDHFERYRERHGKPPPDLVRLFRASRTLSLGSRSFVGPVRPKLTLIRGGRD
jgi:hypothetical protein